MRREALLGGTAALVVGGTVLLAALVPGVVAERTPEPQPPGSLGIDEVSIASGPVSGASATLRVDVRLRHRRGPSDNVTVEYRAIDADSGLIAAERRVSVGTVRTNGQRRVIGNLTVPREGAYRIRTVVYGNDRQIDTGSTVVRGVGNLDPAYAASPVRFERFGEVGVADLPVIEYAVADARDGRVRLNVSTYLTNGGDRPTDDLRVVFTVRQSDSNIVADRAGVEVGEIRPGRSATPAVDLTVPDDYNYYLDAVLWKDGVIVDTARSTATLNPNQSISVNRSDARDGLRVGDFEPDDADGETPDPERTRTARGGGDGDDGAGGGGPGFGAVAAIGAILLVIVVSSRWSDDE